MRRIHPFAAAAVLFVLFAASSFGENFALVVGVNKCPKWVVNGVRARALEGAEDDAESFVDLLQTTYGFSKQNVHLLKASDATCEAVEKQFERFQIELHEDDQFVFYFAGHGTQIPDVEPFDEPDGYDEALCPYDAGVQNNQTGEKLIVDDDLAVWLRGISAKRISVIVDTCHSGTIIKGSATTQIQARSVPKLEPIVALPVRNALNQPKQQWHELQPMGKGPAKTVIALYACGADQSAIERSFAGLTKPRDVRGQFTKLLIDYLRANGTNASTKQVADQLKKNIQKQAQLLAPIPAPKEWQLAQAQNPSFDSSDGGNSALIVSAKIKSTVLNKQAVQAGK